jgi:tetratricopeptide (TPR) repeat protein
VIERLLAADSALARGELDTAERQFAAVTAADPRNAIAIVGLARIAARRGDRDAARGLALRALDIDPDEAAAAGMLAELERDTTPVETPVTRSATATAAVSAPARTVRASSWWRRWLDRLRGRA